MKRKSRQPQAKAVVIHVWEYAQAQRALPYIASILGSVREHRLEMQHQQLQLKRLADKPGRPDRETMIAQEDGAKELAKAEGQFEAALEELGHMHVYCLDPVAGQALIPFVHDSRLAWFIFDLFEAEQLKFWRFHEDPLDSRRAITEI